MLSLQNNSTKPFLFAILLAIMLPCALITNAESSEHYSQDPISPIPIQKEVDSNKADLGQALFFDARLSSNKKISCATCHQLENGGDDNVAIGISATTGKHNINTPSIFNAQYNFRQNWDGSEKSLESQIESAIKNPHKFNNNWEDVLLALSEDNKLTHNFNNVYPDGISKKNIINAITEFEKTLTTPNSRFDQYLRNEDANLTEAEIKGYIIFKDLGCISCHQGVNIGGNLYQKFGVFYNYMAERGDIKKPDYGRMNATNRQMDAFVFKVPSLRNVAVTAPYLHDGSAKTIEEAIIIMGKTQLGRKLSTREVRLIKSFLNTLTGEYKNKPLKNKPLDGAS